MTEDEKRPTLAGAERRQGRRLARVERMIARKSLSPGEDAHVEETTSCVTEDVSPEGMRIRVRQPVPEAGSLDLWVKVQDHPGTFLLTGEVKWVSADEASGEYLAGVQIVGAEGVDLDKWREMIKGQLEKEQEP